MTGVPSHGVSEDRSKSASFFSVSKRSFWWNIPQTYFSRSSEFTFFCKVEQSFKSNKTCVFLTGFYRKKRTCLGFKSTYLEIYDLIICLSLKSSRSNKYVLFAFFRNLNLDTHHNLIAWDMLQTNIFLYLSLVSKLHFGANLTKSIRLLPNSWGRKFSHDFQPINLIYSLDLTGKAPFSLEDNVKLRILNTLGPGCSKPD